MEAATKIADAHLAEASRIIAAARGGPSPIVRSFLDADSFTLTHVVSDPATGKAAIIDSVLDFDPASGRTSTHRPTGSSSTCWMAALRWNGCLKRMSMPIICPPPLTCRKDWAARWRSAAT
jgi:hypothetical protein